MSLKYRVASLLGTLGMQRYACAVRGLHVGLKPLGRCLKCGKTNLAPEVRERALERTTLRQVETTSQRNERIRNEARAYGI